MSKGKRVRVPETEVGSVLFNVDPIILKDHYEVDYIHSYAQDSPFFVGLSKGELRGSRCGSCSYTYATPRGHWHGVRRRHRVGHAADVGDGAYVHDVLLHQPRSSRGRRRIRSS